MIPYLDDKLYWFSTIHLLSNNDARKSIVYRASKIHQRSLFLSSECIPRSIYETIAVLLFPHMFISFLHDYARWTYRLTLYSSRSYHIEILNQTGAERRVTWRKLEEKTTTLSALVVSKVQKGFCETNEEINGSTQRCWLNVIGQDAEEPEKQECKTKHFLLGQRITQFRGQARTCKWVVSLCSIAVLDTASLRYIYLKTNRRWNRLVCSRFLFNLLPCHFVRNFVPNRPHGRYRDSWY